VALTGAVNRMRVLQCSDSGVFATWAPLVPPQRNAG
jgi:hypothetical protein